jgi:hypothetical protein
LSVVPGLSRALPEAVTSDPVCTNDCEEVTWAPWSLNGDEDPAWPAWAACAGRHTIRIPNARIRTIRPNSPFIQVHYAEKLHKYNLIAAATYQVKIGVL